MDECHNGLPGFHSEIQHAGEAFSGSNRTITLVQPWASRVV